MGRLTLGFHGVTYSEQDFNHVTQSKPLRKCNFPATATKHTSGNFACIGCAQL
ncbi:hypothetical protein Cflav_PD1911 [Pedosphaera parvula Ellin514]|uniref:Uncharacterized protein n=1 Tax=Pedosphaera parvula (strain Ellin514) TaxID=320771 RepID=B9XLG0_PEDPL|nr:hypothetical protein Cflav_PD1911 [Pedosphaera parvula Ellin514]